MAYCLASEMKKKDFVFLPSERRQYGEIPHILGNFYRYRLNCFLFLFRRLPERRGT